MEIEGRGGQERIETEKEAEIERQDERDCNGGRKRETNKKRQIFSLELLRQQRKDLPLR